MHHARRQPWGSRFCLAMLAALAVAPAQAHEVKAGGLTIVHPWVRATLPGLPNSTAYVLIRNAGTEADRLTAVTIAGAARVELHTTITSDDGVMQMRAVPEGVAVPPAGEVQLAPGGTHLMVMGLTSALVTETAVPGTLTFAKAGTIAVTFVVHPPGSRGTAHEH